METLDSPSPVQGRGRYRSVAWLLFGVLWPLGTIIFELSTHACAGAFFDPLPTWAHVLAVLCVPGISLRAWWRSGLSDPPPVSPWERFLLGAAWAVATLYVACFLWLTLFAIIMLPMSLVASVEGKFFGFLPAATLGPLWSWLFLWGAQRHLRPENVKQESSSRWRPAPVHGFVAALLVLMVFEIPGWVTLQAAQQARRGSSADKTQLANRVRTWGSEATLLAAAYGNTNGAASPWLWILRGGFLLQASDGGFSVSATEARELYYRAYGRLFTDSPPPRRLTAVGWDEEGRGADSTDGFVWDGDVGGTAVGGARMKGLLLQGSRMDWHLDEPSRIAYGEWTLEFQNQHANAQEARCQMLLPPGGFVSRLTLWVNGEPREAAFAGQAKVREAYQKVAVVERRDPVLVTQVGPDRVLTQCFPVPPRGSMKIRLGITAPLSDGALHLPLLLERNFTITGALRHAVDVQGTAAFNAGDKAAEAQPGQPYRWRGELAETSLTEHTFRLTQINKAATLWCEDPLAGAKPRMVIATPREETASAAKKWIVVVDGSVSLRSRREDLHRAVQHLSQDAAVQVLLAVGAGYEDLGQGKDIPGSAFRGGSDNAAALTHALDLARKEPGTQVLWLHGQQPFEFPDLQALKQLIERSQPPPQLYTLALAQGPNRLLESLHGQASVQSPGRAEDLPSLLSALDVCRGGRSPESWTFARSDSPPATGQKVWDHLARVAVFQEVMQGYQSGADSATLASLAAQHHLVTPVSGAVVLETLEQYRAAGLDPGDPNASPKMPLGIPEPSRAMLVMMGVAWALLCRRRK